MINFMELHIIKEQEILGKTFTMYGTIENPLFLAQNVAEWIDYSKTSQGYYNVSKMLLSVDDDEKSTITNGNSGGSKAFLTEDGLYEVLMQSRKPIAKQFKHEVKSILKQMRLTGGAVVDNREGEFIENYFKSFSEETKLAMVQDLHIQNRMFKEQIFELQPQAEAFQDLMTAQGYIKFIDVAQSVEIGRNTLFELMRSKKILTKQSSFNVPYGRFKKMDLFKVIYSKDETGHMSCITMVSPKGLNYIYKLIKKNKLESEFDSEKLLTATVSTKAVA